MRLPKLDYNDMTPRQREAHDKHVAGSHRGQRHFADFAVAFAPHDRRLQLEQVPDRVRRSGARAPFELRELGRGQDVEDLERGEAVRRIDDAGGAVDLGETREVGARRRRCCRRGGGARPRPSRP